MDGEGVESYAGRGGIVRRRAAQPVRQLLEVGLRTDSIKKTDQRQAGERQRTETDGESSGGRQRFLRGFQRVRARRRLPGRNVEQMIENDGEREDDRDRAVQQIEENDERSQETQQHQSLPPVFEYLSRGQH